MVHRGILKTDYMPSRFGSRYVFCIFGWIRKCFLPNLCRLLEWQARFHWLKLSKQINRNAKWPTMVNNSVTHQKAQSLKYGNILDTKTKIRIKLHVGYVLLKLVAKLETPPT